MSREEHAERVARNTLELVQARRQLAAVRLAIETAQSTDRHVTDYPTEDRLTDLLADLDAALGLQPASTSGDPA